MDFQQKPVVQSDDVRQKLVFDYKNADSLRRFLTESGSLMNREKTGLTAKQQRVLALHVKRARQIGLLPFVTNL